jgi:hypothetical protein
MKASLIVAKGRRTGDLVTVTGRKFIIGRHPECQLRPGGRTVSQHHCTLRQRGDKLFVKDLGSANGTFINGERATRERELHNEDVLRVGGLTFLVWIEPGKPGEGAPGRPPAESSILDLLLAGSSADSSLGILPEDSDCARTVLESAERSAKKRKAKKPAELPPVPSLSPAVREMLDRFQRTAVWRSGPNDET